MTLVGRFAQNADLDEEQYAPIIRELQRDGYSMRSIATELDKRKVKTPRGGVWHPQLVKRSWKARLVVVPAWQEYAS